MNNFDYKKLTPFKWFVLDNFPFIEEDFDAITNWQLFCKLGNEINKIINSENLLGEQVEDLTTAFNQLQEYVNNYFDNLDVTDEINAKLDQMAAAGAFNPLLQNLFNGYQEQIDNVEENVNTNYNTLNAKINHNYDLIMEQLESIASGSPAGTFANLAALNASTTADTSKIYITLDDNKWNYYDTTNETWTAGGTYLAGETPENITPNQLAFMEQKYYNIFDKTKTLEHGSMDNYGHTSPTSQAHYLTGLCPCKPSTTYYKKNNYSGAFYDSNQDLISYWAYGQTTVTSPANAAYIQSWFANEDLEKYYISTVNRYTPYGYNPFYITDNNLIELIQSIANQNNKVYTNDTDFFSSTDTNILNTKNILTGYALNSDGTVAENANFSVTDYLKLPAPTGELYVSNCYEVVEFDGSFNRTAYHSGNDTVKEFEIAENTVYIKVCFATYRLPNALILINETPESYAAAEKYALQFRTNAQLLSIIDQLCNNATFTSNIQSIAQGLPLTSLKWAAVGDSWTEENNTATKNYVKLVEDALNVDVTNLGLSGTGFKRGEGSSNAYYQRVSSIPIDTDILTVMASGNDLSQGYTMGSATDTGTDSICGCINTFLDNVYTRFTGIRIGIISVAPWQNNTPEDTTNFTTYTNKIKEICNLRGIPFIDIFHQSNLRPNNSTFRTNYMPDGVHPNDNGYKLLSNRIIEFIKTL